MSQIPISIPQKRLAQAISASATTFRLNNILGWDGNALTPADLGSQHFVVFMNETRTVMELMEIDPATIASTDITILNKGLDFNGDETEVAANKLAWAANETIVALGSNPPQLLNNFVDKGREQTITGLKTVPTPTAAGHIATKGYVDDAALGSATVDRVIEAGNAGETVAAGELVYFDTTDNEWKLTDADTATTVNAVKLGIAQGAGTNGNPIDGGVLTLGQDDNQSGMTAGDPMYAGNTAGAISSTTGTTTRIIGIARSATALYFDPNFSYIPTDNEKDAMAGTDGTPSSSNKFVTDSDSRLGVITFNAGATIAGATLPVPVYQNKTDNEVYACDANDTAAYKYIGFATSDGTDGNSINVKLTGIVPGFTGLAEGEKYYVQDAVGTIGTSPGTQEILVGIAISETELLIQKGRRHASGIVEFSSTISTAITTGFRPSAIRIYATGVPDGGSLAVSLGGWTVKGGNLAAHGCKADTTEFANAAADKSWLITTAGGSTHHHGVVDTITDTGFNLANTEVTGSATIYLYWEAEGEL